MLEAFIAKHTYHDPASRVAVRKLLRLFQAELPAEDRSGWTHSRFITELAKLGHEVGLAGNKALSVPGLAMTPPEHWQVVEGRMIKVPA